MDRIVELLSPAHVALDVNTADFDACLTALSGLLEADGSLESVTAKALTTALQDREKLGVTCVGRGVAIPHAYVQGLDRVLMAFGRLSEALEHGAPDGVPIDLVFLLAGPREAQAGHLPLLARVTRLLHDQMLLDELRSAQSAEEALAALQAVEQRHA